MGAFEVPVSGISLGDQMYVVVSTNHSTDRTTDRSVLTKFAPPATFKPLRTISQLPGGRFIKMSLHAAPGPIAGLPPGGPFVFVWGTGVYRKSNAYMSIVPIVHFETGKGTRYFAGLRAAGRSDLEPERVGCQADRRKRHDGRLIGHVVQGSQPVANDLRQPTTSVPRYPVLLLPHAVGTVERTANGV